MSSDFPQYTSSAQMGNQGIRIVENIIHDQFGWIFRGQEGQKDFGIDAHIELTEGDKVLGRSIALQIKCGESFFHQKDKDGYIFYGERKHLNYFLNYPLPVLIVLCDPNTRKCLWCLVDPLEMQDTATGWRIVVPFSQEFDEHAKQRLTHLAGPAKDYLPELKEYWRVNKLLERDSLVLLVIPREQVEAGNIDFALAMLNRIRLTKKLARKHQEKADISIFGYDNDPRELYEIPEVKTWVRKLDESFPYWFFFLSKQLGGLAFVTYCLCKYHKLRNGTKAFKKRSFSRFLEIHFIEMNQQCLALDYTEDEIKELSENVIAYYVGYKPPQDIYSSS